MLTPPIASREENLPCRGAGEITAGILRRRITTAPRAEPCTGRVWRRLRARQSVVDERCGPRPHPNTQELRAGSQVARYRAGHFGVLIRSFSCVTHYQWAKSGVLGWKRKGGKSRPLARAALYAISREGPSSSLLIAAHAETGGTNMPIRGDAYRRKSLKRARWAPMPFAAPRRAFPARARSPPCGSALLRQMQFSANRRDCALVSSIGLVRRLRWRAGRHAPERLLAARRGRRNSSSRRAEPRRGIARRRNVGQILSILRGRPERYSLSVPRSQRRRPKARRRRRPRSCSVFSGRAGHVAPRGGYFPRVHAERSPCRRSDGQVYAQDRGLIKFPPRFGKVANATPPCKNIIHIYRPSMLCSVRSKIWIRRVVLFYHTGRLTSIAQNEHTGSARQPERPLSYHSAREGAAKRAKTLHRIEEKCSSRVRERRFKLARGSFLRHPKTSAIGMPPSEAPAELRGTSDSSVLSSSHA